MKIHSKTASRIAAIQVLYQYEFSNHEQNIGDLMNDVASFYKDAESIEELSDSNLNIKIALNSNYFTNLVNTTLQNISIIDEQIVNHLTGQWKIETLPFLLLSILRVAICELKFFPETPCKVVVNEFTDIANSMLDETEISFVNSTLDNIAKTNAH